MKRKQRPPEARALRLLTTIAIVVGALATLSYATGANIVVRYFDPSTGAWWNEHDFAFMVTSAAALGMLVAIRASARFIADAAERRRAAIASVVAAAVLLPPITRLCAQLARLGWSANSGAIRDRTIALAGYDVGSILDKVIIAAVYFAKVAGLAFIVGLALLMLAVVTVGTFAGRDLAAADARAERESRAAR
jgi:hypothetical protein